ncbi:TetR/AcrR family transcriptional regulator [Weissella paramesenteroides]|uniref:TetR/AcrR family transcriptional regulator n=1 Tax=Weissella paramesenteroides TaxID=1249 RepID=UPI003F7474C8
MKKQPQITEKTKQNFINAFCQLYLQKPIDKISIKDITSLAGYNRSTFYLYFSDIYTLRHFVENDLLDYVRINLAKMDGNTNTQQSVLERLIRLFEMKEIELKAVLGEYGSSNFLRRLKKEVTSTIEIASNFVPGVDPNSNYFSYLLEFNVSNAISLFQLWLQRDKDLTKTELVTLSYQLYNYGVQGTKV